MFIHRHRFDHSHCSHRLISLSLFTLTLFALVGFAETSRALTPIESADISLDITATLDGTTFDDEAVAIDDFVAATGSPLGALPEASDVGAYHLRDNGDELLSFDTTVELSGGVTVSPADVVSYDGVNYTIVFDGSVEGLPAGVAVDAVTEEPDLVLSFDTTVVLDGITFDDEDLARFDGAAFSLYFDGSAEGLNPALDLDAVHVLAENGNLIASFDTSGSIGGVDFDDEDALEYDGATWEMAYDGSAEHAGVESADLDAVNFVPEPGQLLSLAAGLIFLSVAKRRRTHT